MAYTFGDSERAAARLENMAAFFNPLAAAFLRSLLTGPVPVSVDLGCGPGFTTDMLAKASGSPETIGLDNSENFLTLARNRFPHLRFVLHDITKDHLPVAADLVYLRFVLSHIAQPRQVTERIVSSLAHKALLVIEELEDIESEVTTFRDYLATNAAIVASGGSRLYIGKYLSEMRTASKVLHSERLVLPVPDWQAATWFLPNTQTIWKSTAAQGIVAEAQIEQTAASLQALTHSPEHKSRITWIMRRMVIQRSES